MRIVGHAYPWDVLGDPGFVERVHELGVTEVSLAASYHSTRAATPLHPRHSHVEAPVSALYRRPRPEAWRGAGIVARAADWMEQEDPFGEAAAILVDAGIAVHAWVVLAHGTVHGTADPTLGVVNPLGERYPYALCPADPRVRDYTRTLTQEALRDVPLAGVSIEACGQLGFTHGGPHEKTDGAYGPVAESLLSVCCCPHCAEAWRERGGDPVEIRSALAAAVDARRAGYGDEEVEEVLGADLAALLLGVRHAAADALRAGVLAAVADRPGDRLRTTLHAHPDPWRTGASPGLTPTAAADVDAVLVPVWTPTPVAVADVRSARQLVGDDGPAVAAYLTVLPPRPADEVEAHAAAVVGAGADELHLYHLGLAGPERLEVLRRVVRRAG